MNVMKQVDKCAVVDLFAGVGGLTHGFVCEGFHVAAGVEAEASFKHAYERIILALNSFMKK